MKTRMASAKIGKSDKDLRYAAESEQIEEKKLLECVAKGTVVVVRNRKRDIQPLVVGENTRIKINANIGTSTACHELETELEKLKVSVSAGADAVMDLSTGGPIAEVRKKILETSPVAIGTVPIYQAVADNEKDGKRPHQMKADDFMKIIERQCEEGVDFMTIHCGINRHTANTVLKNKRLTGVVSRGGALILEWMSKNGKENPYFENFDDLLSILREYDVTISLGDGLRPGSLHDATDTPQMEELRELGKLVERCREAGVQSIVEGPGHVPLQDVVKNIKLQKEICRNAPFYVLGPLVTDISPGYDHIAGAIGGAIAATAGADFLCYLTPAEHLRLPSLKDVKEGVIASKIAAHAADIARGIPGAIEWDHKISRAKADLDWAEFVKLCLDPVKAQQYRDSLPPVEKELCSMCGKFCAMKRSRELAEH